MVVSATMASADFCQPFLAPHGTRSTRPIDRSPRVRHATFTLMPAAFTSVLSVQVSGFEDIGLLTQYDRLVCESHCVRLPACGFLQPTPHDANLAVRLAVPLAGPAEDLHLQVLQLVTDANLAVRLAVPLAGPAEDLHLQVLQLVTTTS
jgi:hypothetical protein